jgi:hypothetical protein
MSQAIREYREEAGDILEVWEREINRIYGLDRNIYVKSSDYNHIDEAKRYPEG